MLVNSILFCLDDICQIVICNTFDKIRSKGKGACTSVVLELVLVLVTGVWNLIHTTYSVVEKYIFEEYILWICFIFAPIEEITIIQDRRVDEICLECIWKTISTGY